MTGLLNNRPYSKEKTGIEDLEKLRQVRDSLISQSGTDRLKDRARNRRQFNTPPVSNPVVPKSNPIVPESNPTTKTSDAPYRVNYYNPDTDSWNVQSTANPSDQFSAKAIKAGGVAIGSLVRGYPPIAIEQKPQGRRFKPEDTKPVVEDKKITITINIGYTGKL